MSWRDRYQQASFRGVPFKVRTHDTQIGRRATVIEYPQRDLPYTEDMGRRARRYTVRAIVVGDDYDNERNRLVAAFEEYGPGVLVHPAYGRVSVALDGPVTISESPSQEGGKAEISATFVESGENAQPAQSVDTQSLVESAADGTINEAINDFLDEFSIDGLPDVSQTGAIAVLDDALQSIDTVTRRIFVNPTGLYSMISKLGQLQGNVARLLSAPRTISERLTQMVSGLAALGFAGGDSGTARQVVAAMSLLSSSGSAAAYIPAFTESRRQEAANRDAVTALVSRTAVAESVRVQTAINYDSVDDAEAMRDLLGDQIDALADVAPDAVYRSLTRLRVAMVQDITRRGADLSRVRTTTLGATLPSVVVAHALLGDARRADEIVSRNRIRHPGFVPGGVPLEIVAQ
ncbi:MAG: hypothetical protein C4516_04375 [Oxalobacter sp.]|nr:MAG: hypothetical protein C4516_04375 [Oxalobacter sp.]